MIYDKTNVLKNPIISVNAESLQNGYKIPNIIHFTFCNKNLPIEVLRVIEHNKKMCSNCKFYFYDDNDCDQLIKNNFNPEIYNAYKKINPTYGAMRADFFRYCVLYLYGGVYIDIKSKINYPIFKIIRPNDICILDIPRTDREPWRVNSPTFEQWLLIFAPRHPYLLSTINLMCKYIDERYIPTSVNGIPLTTKGKVLNITGPDAFSKAIKKSILNNNNNVLHRCLDYDTFSKLNCEINYKKMYKMNNKKHYSEVNEPIYV